MSNTIQNMENIQSRNMHTYIHKVQYYETDKMGITHHSNYIRWMEEARIDFLDHIGYGYAKLEYDGIISPVIGVDCQYKHPTTFNDEIEIIVRVEEFKGVRLVISYTMTDRATGSLVLTGKTMHCFMDVNGRPLILKKRYPAFDAVLREQADKVKEES